MAQVFDYKKKYKEFYLPPAKPQVVDVPEFCMLAVDGKGNPNTAEAYQKALEMLYGISYCIKMSRKQPEGYFDYVVAPLEGLWWLEGEAAYDGQSPSDKDQFCWTSMIRQPEFVTESVLEGAKAELARKKPNVDTSAARLLHWKEGLCVQMMHIGSYDDELVSVRQMETYMQEQGYRADFSSLRRHHEIYLSDPRKTVPEKLQTVIRHPVARG